MYDSNYNLGERPIARCDALGEFPYSENPGILNRPYLTVSHRNTLELLRKWMGAAGMSVRLDPLGNLIGRYEGSQANAKALILGSHIDTVRNGGRYDGALGIMLGIECVEALFTADRRLPFAIEVIAFGDEEGSRFPASMLCSRGITEDVGAAVKQLMDEQGISLHQALFDFGLNPIDVARAIREPDEVLAYVEAHIEQGPVLESENLAIGVVTGIAAQLRLKASFKGQAGHAGTTPMTMRRDAIAGAAEAILAVEQICGEGPADLRGTVGRVQLPASAYNVIAGQMEIGIDLRAASVETRDAAADRIFARLQAIATARGLQLDFAVVQDLPACPCDPRLIKLMTEAVEAVGVRPCHLVSGAGHDAMTVSRIAPVAMLFIRCEKGISHNPAERVAAHDVEMAGRALVEFVERMGAQAA